MILIKAPTKFDFIVLKAFNNEKTFDDICRKYIPKSVEQTKTLSESFQGLETKKLCRKIYEFCRNNINYKLDDEGFEQIRLPRQTWKDRLDGVDCEDFVIFCSSILNNLRVKHTVRMADYGNGWQHIYIVLERKEMIVLDPTLSVFNKQFKAKKLKDFTFNFHKNNEIN